MVPAGYIQIWVIWLSHRWRWPAACDSHSNLHSWVSGAGGDLPEQTLQGMGWLQNSPDHPPVLMTWSTVPVPMIAHFYLGKPFLAWRTKKKESSHSWDAQLGKGNWNKKTVWIFLNSLFLNTEMQNKLISVPIVCLNWRNHILSHDYSGATDTFLQKMRWESLNCSSPFSWVSALTSLVH